jgi:hypothetical protein
VIVLATPPAALAGANEAGRQKDETTGLLFASSAVFVLRFVSPAAQPLSS